MQVGLGPCKGKDTATALGLWLVTTDELEPCRDADGFLALALTAEVNGEVVGRDLLSNMSWTFEELVAYASRGTEVRPGDVLGSGTRATAAASRNCGAYAASRPRASEARRHRHVHRTRHRQHRQHGRQRRRAGPRAQRPQTPAEPAVINLVGKVIVVTGAARGQGAAEAALLARIGAKSSQ